MRYHWPHYSFESIVPKSFAHIFLFGQFISLLLASSPLSSHVPHSLSLKDSSVILAIFASLSYWKVYNHPRLTSWFVCIIPSSVQSMMLSLSCFTVAIDIDQVMSGAWCLELCPQRVQVCPKLENLYSSLSQSPLHVIWSTLLPKTGFCLTTLL